MGSSRRVVVSLLLAGTVAGAAGAIASSGTQPESQVRSAGEHPQWDDGKAELSRYAAEAVVEGERRSFTAWSIVVSEWLDPRQMVKVEAFDPGVVPVLKCNWTVSIPTGVAAYQQMATLFMRRADALVMKAAFSSQEWCGITFASWRRDREGMQYHSYWDGEADGTWPIEKLATNALFHEQVPLWIRLRHPERARTEPVTLIRERLFSARCPPPKQVAAAIWFDGIKGTDPDGGADPRRIEARLLVDKQVETFVLAPEFPHVLREWRRADGTTWRLEKSVRLDYWNSGKNEFESLLK
ncbi:MAG: hypothetical protein FJ293_05160 [Planctomycetes bacterium]|nr:hypothetical protein [Planctomycetota bacterium]